MSTWSSIEASPRCATRRVRRRPIGCSARPSPFPLERQTPLPRRDERADLRGPPRSRWIVPGRRRALEQRLRYLPQTLNPFGGREERAVADHGVVDEPLVRLEHVLVLRCLAEREMHARLVEVHPGARTLAVERQ